jgi:protein-disulfide isomerase
MLNRVIYSIVALLVILVAVTFYVSKKQNSQLDGLAHGLVMQKTPQLGFGPEDSAFQVTEFLDYRCHACRAIYPTITELLENNPNIRYNVYIYPIFGKASVRDGQFVIVAAHFGKFKEAHDYMLTRSFDEKKANNEKNAISDKEAHAFAKKHDIDGTEFLRLLNSPENLAHFQDVIELARKYDLKKTPTFVVNGKVMTSEERLLTVDDFNAALGIP